MENKHNQDSKDKLEVLADEKHPLLDHNYDGIHELNHPLPRWWNFIFYTSVIYSIGYFLYYVIFSGPSLQDEHKSEMAKIRSLQEEYKKQNAGLRLKNGKNSRNLNTKSGPCKFLPIIVFSVT